MRALTFYQPWGTAIVSGPKRIENRPWKAPDKLIGQTFLIHAGKTYDKDGAESIRELWPELPEDVPQGCIIGAARLVAVVFLRSNLIPQTNFFEPALSPGKQRVQDVTLVSCLGGDQAPEAILSIAEKLSYEIDPWFFGPYGWILDQVVAFPRPADLKCRGYQTLWTPPGVLDWEIGVQFKEAHAAA